MKKLAFGSLKFPVMIILIAGMLGGAIYFYWLQSKRPRPTENEVAGSESVAVVDPLVEEWNDLKANSRFQKCYQSQKDMNKLVSDIEPEYKQTLNKEANGGKLTIQDRYVRYIYGLWQARAKDYSVFDNFNNGKQPKNNLDSMKYLVDYIYCPDMSKVSKTYPANVGTCQEAALAWMNPFEIPMPQNFKLTEEYELAKKKFKEGLIRSANNAKSCCLLPEDTSSLGGICGNLKAFMK